MRMRLRRRLRRMISRWSRNGTEWWHCRGNVDLILLQGDLDLGSM